MKRIFLMLVLLAAADLASARKQPLTHEVYDGWESLGGAVSPYNGRYLYYTLSRQQGDGILYLYDVQSGAEQSVPRGKSPVLTRDGTHFICSISPLYRQTRTAKIQKLKGDRLPQDSLLVIDLKTGKRTAFEKVKSFKTARECSRYIAFTSAVKDSLSSLFILDLSTMKTDTLKWVDKYSFCDDEKDIYYVSGYDSTHKAGPGLYRYELQTRKTCPVLKGEKGARLDLPVFNRTGDRYLFYAQTDTTGAMKEHTDLYYGDRSKGDQVEKIVTDHTDGMKKDWMLSSKAALYFSDDNSYFVFGTRPVPPQKDTATPDFEKAGLDIWVWNAEYTPPMKKAAGEYYDRSYTALYRFDRPGKMLQIMDESFASLRPNRKSTQRYMLATVDEPYRVQKQWNYQARVDLYRIDLLTGDRKLLIQDDAVSYLKSSPRGNYYTWYNAREKHWYLYDVKADRCSNVTRDLGRAFWNEEDDTPDYAAPYSPATWYEDESAFVIQDRYDLWAFDPRGLKAPYMLTQGQGLETRTSFRLKTDIFYTPQKENKNGVLLYSGVLYPDEPLYFSTFNRETRETGIYALDPRKRQKVLVKMIEGPYTYALKNVITTYDYLRDVRAPRKLKIPVIVYTASNFETPPQLKMSRNLFRETSLIAASNKQQSGYNWGTVELVSWQKKDGSPLDGLLYKPEDFDAAKKYPLMIYFYEKSSDGLYTYKTPAPSRSVINIPYFVSNGYIVFVPDIRYEVGHPGRSAMDCIMPGVDMLCKHPWIDAEHMAIQGQSWGGYQVAYMITQTDRFKAAGAGAPVSNMTSAYGGIRWESGMTRQFQYELGQSRIGKDLWEGFDLYVENSPLFFVPKVKTPVLIMHNDKDGAVPWYQGIEFFVGLRRCGKPAWLLQYNGESHNLSQRKNAKDLSVRLSEFFDHFLKGAPEPEWMKVKRP